MHVAYNQKKKKKYLENEFKKSISELTLFANEFNIG